MIDTNTVKIVMRFYEALDVLIANKKIRGVKTFTDKYEISRWNLNTVRKTPESGMFKLAWLSFLIVDFGVSAEWLMTGEGWMFGTDERLPLKKNGTRN